MYSEQEKRRQPRIRYSWPLWFGYEENGELTPAQVVDLSPHGVSFKCDQNRCPQPGHHILTRFSFPCEAAEDAAMDSYSHWAEVVRVEEPLFGKRRIAVRLHQHLLSQPRQPSEALAMTIL